MKPLLITKMIVGLLFLNIFYTYSHAHGTDVELTGIYKSRHIYMEGLGKSMKALSNFVKRDVGDPNELMLKAAEIASNSGKLTELFPPGTGMDDFEHSEAKANIWTQWDDFVQAAQKLAARATDVATAFENNLDEVGPAVEKLSQQGCRSCHQQFREKKD